MSEFNVLLFSLTLYKILTLLVGLASLFFGYRLFSSGTYKKAGDLSSRWGDKNLVLKQAAPGTFFALFGAIIISVGLLKGFSVEKVEGYPLDAQRGVVNIVPDINSQVLPESDPTPPQVQALPESAKPSKYKTKQSLPGNISLKKSVNQVPDTEVLPLKTLKDDKGDKRPAPPVDTKATIFREKRLKGDGSNEWSLAR